jgi:hypothetical protein
MVRLRPLPSTFGATRAALHRVAEELLAPARKPENEIALTQTPGGFGTPPFEFGHARLQVRVEGAELVLEEDGTERRGPIRSIADGARFLGPDLVAAPQQDGQPLGIDPEATARLADFYAVGAEALSRFRTSLPAADEASEINLWPEHFDIALEAGDEAAGLRANYGASPGDEHHPDPYLYVGPWTAKPTGGPWNARGFNGAELGYDELASTADPVAAAVEFFTSRRQALPPAK